MLASRGPRPHKGPHPCRSARCPPVPSPLRGILAAYAQLPSGSRPRRLRLACCVRSRARPPPLLRSPGPAPPPSLRSPGPGLPCLPPAPTLGRLCAAARLRGRSLPPSACGPALASLRAPCSVALAVLGLGPCAARRPVGGRCGPAVAASRCALGRPSRGLRPRRCGFGPGGSPRGPPAACGRLFPLRGPRVSAARPRLRGLAVALSGCVSVGRAAWACVRLIAAPLLRPGALGSPLRPSRPRRPRRGLRGGARPVGGPAGPRRGAAFRSPLRRLPRGDPGPRCADRRPVDSP